MHAINRQSTEIINAQLAKLSNGYLKLVVPNHDELMIRMLEPITVEPSQKAVVISMRILSDETNYDWPYEMQFLVIDERDEKGREDAIDIYPVYYWDEANDVTDRCVYFSQDRIESVDEEIQLHMVRLAESWIMELDIAGYFSEELDTDH